MNLAAYKRLQAMKFARRLPSVVGGNGGSPHIFVPGLWGSSWWSLCTRHVWLVVGTRIAGVKGYIEWAENWHENTTEEPVQPVK